MAQATRTYAVVGIGHNNNMWASAPNTSVTGGISKDWAKYVSTDTYIVDCRPIPYAAMVQETIGGPMLDETLEPGTMKTGIFEPKILPYDPSTVKGFDYIALDVWLARKRAIGAVITQDQLPDDILALPY